MKYSISKIHNNIFGKVIFPILDQISDMGYTIGDEIMESGIPGFGDGFFTI